MRRRISIRGNVRPSVRRSVGPSVPRYFQRRKVRILGASWPGFSILNYLTFLSFPSPPRVIPLSFPPPLHPSLLLSSSSSFTVTVTLSPSLSHRLSLTVTPSLSQCHSLTDLVVLLTLSFLSLLFGFLPSVDLSAIRFDRQVEVSSRRPVKTTVKTE